MASNVSRSRECLAPSQRAAGSGLNAVHYPPQNHEYLNNYANHRNNPGCGNGEKSTQKAIHISCESWTWAWCKAMRNGSEPSHLHRRWAIIVEFESQRSRLPLSFAAAGGVHVIYNSPHAFCEAKIPPVRFGNVSGPALKLMVLMEFYILLLPVVFSILLPQTILFNITIMFHKRII